eukprot:scaffold458619_cov32-Prasinocladus_malaysianus.AAC.1
MTKLSCGMNKDNAMIIARQSHKGVEVKGVHRCDATWGCRWDASVSRASAPVVHRLMVYDFAVMPPGWKTSAKFAKHAIILISVAK